MKRFNGRSVVLGVVLCAALVVMMGSKAEGPQVGPTTGKAPEKILTLNDLGDKCDFMDKRLVIIMARLNKLEEQVSDLAKSVSKISTGTHTSAQLDQKVDSIAEELHSVLKSVRFIENKKK